MVAFSITDHGQGRKIQYNFRLNVSKKSYEGKEDQSIGIMQ